MKVNTNVRETHFEVKWVAEMTGRQGEGRGEDVTQSCHYVMKFDAPKMDGTSICSKSAGHHFTEGQKYQQR